MPDTTPLFDRAMPVLASLDIAASLELYVWDPSGNLVKFGQVTDRFMLANGVQDVPSEQASAGDRGA